MTLRNIPYTTSSGEWLPHNAGNYTSRSKAMFFFHSLDNATTLLNSDITFTNSVDLSVGSTETMSDEWPLSTDVIIGPTNLPALQKPAYQLTYSSVTGIIDIILTGPYTNATYALVSAPDGTSAADQNIFDSYKTDIGKILEFNKSTSSFDINSNFRSFRWGNIERADGTGIDCDGVVSTPSFISITESPALGFSPSIYNLKLQLSNNQDFPADLYQGNLIWATSSTTGVIQFNPELLPSSLTGNLIEVNNPVAANIQSNTYLLLGNNLGRYYVKGVYEKDPSTYVLDVDRIDGEEFQLGSHTGVSISDISVRPRLRIKYRVATDPNPTVIYNFYSKDETSLPGSSSAQAVTSLECDQNSVLFEAVDGNDGVFDMGGVVYSNFISRSFRSFPFGVPTTLVDASTDTSRVTPWRKGYRALNRFRFKEVNLKQVRAIVPPLDGTLKFELSPKSAALSFNNSTTYPNAIPHRPALIHEKRSSAGSSGRGNICFTHTITLLESTGTVNEGLPNTATHTVERGTNGILVEEGQSNQITFIVNTSDTGNHPLIDSTGDNYNYTGKISCASTVIPAYSGEILAFDSSNFSSPTHGFIETNYQLPSGDITPTAVFIDISETDEVLRWNGSEYDPANIWSQTFTSLQIQNLTTGNQIAIDSSSYEVLKSEKDNYIVVLHTDDTDESLAINDGDEMRLTLRNKKVVPDFENTTSPASHMAAGEYIPIEYRPLEKEWIDDILVPFVAPSIPNFTITSDGTVDGTITIVPDGDLPEGVEFRLYIQDDETTP
jgi:hypothetical protein